MADVAVLVLDEIADYSANCSRLVVLDGSIKCVSVAIFVFPVTPFNVFIFVENRVLLTKQGRVAVVKQERKTHGVKTHNGTHVGPI